jgi:serine phosphatase RsbU (regulator of sigma subunit)
LRSADGTAHLVEQVPAPPLGFGLLEGSNFEEAEVTMLPGDALVFYSDGLIERRGEGIDDGLAHLVEAARFTSQLSASELCEHLLSSLVKSSEQFDDVAILVLQIDD